MKRGTVRVKCLAQEHNTIHLPPASAWTRVVQFSTNHEAIAPALYAWLVTWKYSVVSSFWSSCFLTSFNSSACFSLSSCWFLFTPTNFLLCSLSCLKTKHEHCKKHGSKQPVDFDWSLKPASITWYHKQFWEYKVALNPTNVCTEIPSYRAF